MVSGSAGVKIQAKMLLRNNWGKAIAVLAAGMLITVIFSLLVSIVGIFVAPMFEYTSENGIMVFKDTESNYYWITVLYAIYFIIYMFRFLIESPFSLGSKDWHYSLAMGGEAEFSRIFTYFSKERFGRSIHWSVSRGMRLLGWDLLVLLAPIIFSIGGAVYAAFVQSEEVIAVISVLSVLLFLISIPVVACMHIVNTLRYFLVPYILTAHPEMNVGDAFRMSIRYMRGYKTEIFSLGLSFIGWLLLTILAVPVIFVNPYYNTSFANAAKWIIFNNEKLAAEAYA